MSRGVRVCAAVLALLFAAEATAHHNMTALFDFNDRVSFDGTLTKIDWRNPHIYMTVDAKMEKATETWVIEGPSPSFFRIRDFGKADFEQSIGKIMKVELSRARDKSRTGLIRTLTFPNGKVVSACPQNC